MTESKRLQEERIFISYRRADSAGYAGRIYDRLAGHFGENAIFMDVDTIEGGSDFIKVLEDAVQSCDVLIALIGKQWLTIKDKDGKSRLDNPEDFVRIEIATALKRNIRVIPVLVDGVDMPQSIELPENLKALARRNALQVDHHSFNPDVYRLIEHLENALGVDEQDRLRAMEEERKRIAREKAERIKAEKKARQKARFEAFEKFTIRNKNIIISLVMVLFLCVIIFSVVPVITKSDISSTPVSSGISDLNIPPFSAAEDIYVYFNSNKVLSTQKFTSRWFLKVNALWTDLYVPVGYLEYIPVNRDSHLFFHLKNPGIAGEYRVDIYMDQYLVGTQTFEIYPKE